MYKASINQYQFDIATGNESTVDGVVRNIEFSRTAKKSFSITVNGITKEADVVRFEKENKQITLRIEGRKYTIQLKQPIDILLEKLGINTQHHKKINHLKAPMPGLVSKILVAIGDQVEAGKPLLILEAMKMENVFKASTDVIIKDIKIDEKQTVEKGEVLIVFE